MSATRLRAVGMMALVVAVGLAAVFACRSGTTLHVGTSRNDVRTYMFTRMKHTRFQQTWIWGGSCSMDICRGFGVRSNRTILLFSKHISFGTNGVSEIRSGSSWVGQF